MLCKNNGVPFCSTKFEELVGNVCISVPILENRVNDIITRGNVTGLNEKIWALKALMLTDLTTLSGDDTPGCVERLCTRAAHPFPDLSFAEAADLHDRIHPAAVCVYPSRVKDAATQLKILNKTAINVASVATGFPTGLYPLETRIKEVEIAIMDGANEIDIVIDRSKALLGHWQEIYNEISQMKEVCKGKACLKTILGVGELGTMDNVYKASMVAMMAGSDFIKTSTGKESVNATLPVGLVMIEAIQDYKREFGFDVGLKPAGGVRTVKDAINWMILIKETLGLKYLSPSLFRFGASGLLDNIEKLFV